MSELIEQIASVIAPLLAVRIPGVEDGGSCVGAEAAALECAVAVVESLGFRRDSVTAIGGGELSRYVTRWEPLP
jgi:hypothetical protein